MEGLVGLGFRGHWPWALGFSGAFRALGFTGYWALGFKV